MENLINKLHQSPLYGRFVENGGPSVVAELLKVDKASSTVYHGEIPYAKQLGNLTSGRAVSIENTWAWLQRLAQESTSLEVNFDYVSTFQISERSTHGYIGIRLYGKSAKIYHISINDKNLSRSTAIDYINETSVKLLTDEVINTHVDAVYKLPIKALGINEKFIENIFSKSSKLEETLNYITQSKYDNCCYIDFNGNICRLEDFIRSGQNLIVYKGSFNPIHNAHLDIIETTKQLTQQKYQNTDIVNCFSISTNTFDKGICDIDNLIQRIKWINQLGYGVIIYNQPLFEDLIWLINGKMNDKQTLTLPLGVDTYSRMKLCYDNDISRIEELPVKFIIFDRDGNNEYTNLPLNVEMIKYNYDVSSSAIRKGNNLDNVPDKIKKEVIDYYGQTRNF